MKQMLRLDVPPELQDAMRKYGQIATGTMIRYLKKCGCKTTAERQDALKILATIMQAQSQGMAEIERKQKTMN